MTIGIYDSDGRELATNFKRYRLNSSPYYWREVNKTYLDDVKHWRFNCPLCKHGDFNEEGITNMAGLMCDSCGMEILVDY